MELRKVIGTVLLTVAATAALHANATAAPRIDTGSAGSGSADGSSGGTLCNDGTSSPSTGAGTCSHHGGEARNSGHVHHGGRR